MAISRHAWFITAAAALILPVGAIGEPETCSPPEKQSIYIDAHTTWPMGFACEAGGWQELPGRRARKLLDRCNTDKLPIAPVGTHCRCAEAGERYIKRWRCQKQREKDDAYWEQAFKQCIEGGRPLYGMNYRVDQAAQPALVEAWTKEDLEAYCRADIAERRTPVPIPTRE